jgi:hypothetical protein
MKIRVNVNIEKKHFFILLSAIIILAGIFAVNAYNLSGIGGTPGNMGHSVDEMDWGKQIQGNINISGNISSAGVCIGGDCKNSWPTTSSTGITTLTYLQYNLGRCDEYCPSQGYTGCILAAYGSGTEVRPCSVGYTYDQGTRWCLCYK